MRLIEKKTGITLRFDLLRAAPEITGDAYQVKHARFLIWPGRRVYFVEMFGNDEGSLAVASVSS